jgi:hypothetical protein
LRENLRDFLEGQKTGTVNGTELIAIKRKRQITAERGAREHDEEQFMGEMAAASMFYHERNIDKDIRSIETELRLNSGRGRWLFGLPSPGPIRNLVKAGRLIAAWINPLQRRA